ncbi:MAG TPA: hypothetical protein VLD19_11720 [Chitinophagaceae bacterium]|nr:hypothetical protein [Chitinophagaceae bacterium]
MLLSTDKQTMDDLGMAGRSNVEGIPGLYNRCITRGGSDMLGYMFNNPYSAAEAISRRLGIIRFFSTGHRRFPYMPANFDVIEQYLADKDERIRLKTQGGLLGQLEKLGGRDLQSDLIAKGVHAALAFIGECRAFYHSLVCENGHDYFAEYSAVISIMSLPAFSDAAEKAGKLSDEDIAHFDGLFRFRERDRLYALLRHAYLLDVYIAVGRVAQERNFSFPVVVQQEEPLLELDGFYHPLITNPVANSLHLSGTNHVIFLTGANMAGKSTLMKSASIVLLLAHMGFPVPAARMKFAPFDGIYTTINLPDNLGIGASHFYAEVMRVKKIVQELASGKRLFVVFDELFRGTNVKDAYEGTVAIIRGFAGAVRSIFIISTHVLEAADTLSAQCTGIQYVYMPTEMNGRQPVYSYRMKDGISTDRHGMIIVHNEGIIEKLKQGLKKSRSQ